MNTPDISLTRRQLFALCGGTAATSLAAWKWIVPSAPDCSGRQITDLAPPALGAQTAPVTVAIFTDYACPHCKDFLLNTLPTVRDRVSDETATYVHHDFPIPVSDWSFPVASAARAVQRTQSDSAFWEFTRRAFEQQDNYSTDTLERIAREIDADPQPVRHAAEELPYCHLLKQSHQRGTERGVEGTPTVFVDDRMLEGPPADELATAIRNAL